MVQPRRRPTAVCPQCGGTFPAGRLACPECGSDARTGWKPQQEIDYESVDLPDGDGPPARPGPIPPAVMWIVAVVLLVAFVLWIA